MEQRPRFSAAHLWQQLRHPGVAAALGAALLFGTGTPIAKALLNSVNPWLLAALLYLGSGTGLTLYRWVFGGQRVQLTRSEVPWLAGAILSGGVMAPVLLMMGLRGTEAASASLLLNAEGVFTTLIAWFVFKENFDRRIAIGMCLILGGALILSWPTHLQFDQLWPTLAVLGACLGWAADNNLTRKVSLSDASWIASIKGLSAGVVNLVIAFVLGAKLPAPGHIASALLLGLLAYGVSLTLFVVGLRHLGAARTGAYFSSAPFLGALISILMGEPVTWTLLAAGTLMAAGLWLHLSEHHKHLHTHEALTHTHEHTHDEHHHHAHAEFVALDASHSHQHTHTAMTHTHPHFPDSHHQHPH